MWAHLPLRVYSIVVEGDHPRCILKCQGDTNQLVFDAKKRTYSVQDYSDTPEDTNTTTPPTQLASERKDVSIELDPSEDDTDPGECKWQVGDDVLAHYLPATILVLHPNKSVQVQYHDGDIVTLPPHAIMTSEQLRLGTLSFSSWRSAGRRLDNGAKNWDFSEFDQISYKQQGKISSDIQKSVDAENILRMQQHWPRKSHVLNTLEWEKQTRPSKHKKGNTEDIQVARCTCCNVYFKSPKSQNIAKHFKSVAHWLKQTEADGLQDSAAAPSGVSQLAG